MSEYLVRMLEQGLWSEDGNIYSEVSIVLVHKTENKYILLIEKTELCEGGDKFTMKYWVYDDSTNYFETKEDFLTDIKHIDRDYVAL